ncbi:acyl-CoA thioester hydrolase/BAAT C-terminal domain-containing protein [Halorussus amylolyticus]|uniref:acyl-CoA thioester hydrolase/BAAT C-terminal domain-containing protein n=1 Tax=Halorussus amylolyticus TaxID=1126242 RepID=UPI001051849B|nr:acyl-CoA thioester hydrolase/BAAT C-terminal domain-containing protein [Halorussus amylolyticus]
MVSRRSALQCIAAGTLTGVVGRAESTGDEDLTNVNGELRVSPKTVQYDEPFTLQVRDVTPNAAVVLTARTVDRKGSQWSSFAQFTAPPDGVVDITKHAPDAGTYDGVAPMGLVWSMRPADGDTSIFVPPEDNSRLTLTASVDGQRIGRQTITRRIGPENLEARESPDGLIGRLFRPRGDGPFPSVIALHGSGGRPDYGTALMLAAHGYAVFAPQYFGPPDPLPDQLAEVPLEYLERGYEWLRGLPAVRDAPVGLLGSSKGAEMALLAGATFDWVGAVVAYAPSAVVWAGLTYGGETISSWTLNGEPVPFVPTAFPPSVVGDYVASWPLGESVSLRPTYEVGLEQASDERIAEATIPVENIDGPVTLVSGDDDKLWPSARFGQMVTRRLRDHDHPYPVRHVTTEAAGHAVSFPYQPTTGLTAFDSPLPGTTTALGGSADGLTRAAEKSWPIVLSTLEEGVQ